MVDIIKQGLTRIKTAPDTILNDLSNTKIPSYYNRIQQNAYLSSTEAWGLTQWYIKLGWAFVLVPNTTFVYKNNFLDTFQKNLWNTTQHYGFINGASQAITDTKEYAINFKDEFPTALITMLWNIIWGVTNIYLSFTHYTTCSLFNQTSVCEKGQQYTDLAKEDIYALWKNVEFISKVVIWTTSDQLYKLTNSEDLKILSDYLSYDISQDLWPVVEEMSQAYQDINYIKDNLDSIEDREYWEWVISWYGTVITVEITAAWGMYKIAKDKSWILLTNISKVIFALKDKIWKFKYGISLGNGTKLDNIFNGTDVGWKNNKAAFISYWKTWITQRALLTQKFLDSSINLIKVPNLKGKTYNEAVGILNSRGYFISDNWSITSDTKKFFHSDNSYFTINLWTWRVTRQWAKVLPEWWWSVYAPRFDYLGNKLEKEAHETWEDLIF